MSRKRANAMGSIYKNATRNRWQADLVVGYKPHPTRVDFDGNPIMVPVRKAFTGTTQKAVAAKLDEAMKAIEQGLDVPDNRTTIKAFAAWWLEQVLPGEGLAPATERWYRDVLNTYVLPHVGHRTLTGPTAVTVHDVERMTAELDKAKKSTRVQVGARVALGKVLRAAEQRGLVARNVARLATRPKARGKARTIKALTRQQVAAMLVELEGTRWHPIVIVGATTGHAHRQADAVEAPVRSDDPEELPYQVSQSHQKEPQ